MTTSQESDKEETTEALVSLEDARLQIGDAINLQSQAVGSNERYSVKLIGMLQGRSVLVSTPFVDGKYLLMREGQNFILRAFSGKSVFAFVTQILKSVNAPYPYLHLSYPKEVKSLVVRKGERANVKIICAITRCDETAIQEAGLITNISIGGAQMGAKKTFAQKGQTLHIKFKIVVNGVERMEELKAIVRAVSSSALADNDMPVQYGLQFIDIAPEASIPLLAFVYYQLLEQTPGA